MLLKVLKSQAASILMQSLLICHSIFKLIFNVILMLLICMNINIVLMTVINAKI